MNIFGIISALLFSFCYVPQILKLYKQKKTDGISIGMYWICIIAYLSGIIYVYSKYGIDIILFMNYILGGTLCSITMMYYYKYKQK
jgi:uncharacterized protein with PQ loop repeat